MRLRALWLRALGLSLGGLTVVFACSSPEFTSGTGGSAGTGAVGAEAGEGGAPSTGGTATSGRGGVGGSAGSWTTGGTAGTNTGATGGGGTGGGGTTICTENADCDDMNPCTIDSCTGNGVCERVPKCTGAQPLCCDGVCGECCDQDGCQDNIECTDDVCFAGFCTNTPNDSCGAGRYCGPTGCMDREECSPEMPCNDDNPCTTDTCVDGFCDYASCPSGWSCCPGQGCGLCCIDAQCAAEDDDPCTVNRCEDGTCTTEALCAQGELCCAHAGDGAATCGTCCSAADCPQPEVNCLVAVCGSSCTTQVVPGVCAQGQTCDPREGCVGGSGTQCNTPGDCPPPSDACQTVECAMGRCEYGEVDCSNSTECCSIFSGMAAVAECRECCDNGDCNSGGAAGPLCCPSDGTCHQCCVDTDCMLAVPLGGGQANGGGVIPGTCDIPICLGDRTCGTKSLCLSTEQCCNGVCQPFGTPCINPEI